MTAIPHIQWTEWSDLKKFTKSNQTTEKNTQLTVCSSLLMMNVGHRDRKESRFKIRSVVWKQNVRTAEFWRFATTAVHALICVVCVCACYGTCVCVQLQQQSNHENDERAHCTSSRAPICAYTNSCYLLLASYVCVYIDSYLLIVNRRLDEPERLKTEYWSNYE